MTIGRSGLAARFAMLAVLCALFLSGSTLNSFGLNYSTDSTAGGFKLHPYTILTAIAVVLLACGPRAFERCMAVRQFRTAMAGAAVTFAVLMLKAITGAGQALGFAVDTVFSAFLMAAILPFLAAGITKCLSMALMLFLLIECTIALIEVTTHVNLIPIDTWYGQYFRATALHGHPLNNALILVTVATALQAYARRWNTGLIFLLTVCALVAFGARGALAAYLLVNAGTFIRFGLRSAQRALALIAGGAVSLAGLAWLLFSGLLGDRITQVGAYDDSSQVRVQSIDILNHLNWSRLLVGIDSNQISRLMDEAKVGVIENFAVDYLLMFGAIMAALLFYFVYRTCKEFFAGVSPAGKGRLLAVLFVFVCTALTNNSLATKTSALYLLMVGLWCVRSRFLMHEISR
ncbi:VpsF family polysaccharide biosynthesis protein [Paraburkholderia phytofirmans]|uniref:VpsF family polysaccharide biosynthesis protein n=1 Tax=Paraburkholderia phytofirmans TaxID=261302 RepID=UPI0038B87924